MPREQEVMGSGSKILDKLWAKNQDKISDIWNEGSDGWWIDLYPGWWNVDSFVHCVHASTVRDLLTAWSMGVYKCNQGPNGEPSRHCEEFQDYWKED